jgi:hypothetical protein
MHWTHFALIAVCAFAYVQRVPAISRVATVFLLNAAATTGWAWFVDPYINPVVQLLVDLTSAAVIMTDPAEREQGWIGFIFGVRIGASLAFLSYGIPEASGDYWRLMNMAGQVMMVALLLWSEDNGGHISRFVHRCYRHVLRHFPLHSSN